MTDLRTAATATLAYLDLMQINNTPIAELRAALAEPPAPVFLAVYIGTTNDTNGNPRRGWYVSRIDGEPMRPNAPTDRKGETAPAYTCWVEEGYSGRDALHRAIAGAPQEGETYAQENAHTAKASTAFSGTNRRYYDRARSLVRETGRIEVTPGEYRSARKLPRFGGAA